MTLEEKCQEMIYDLNTLRKSHQRKPVKYEHYIDAYLDWHTTINIGKKDPTVHGLSRDEYKDIAEHNAFLKF